MPKVLCIEDEPQIRQDIVDELDEAGYETLQASNGAEGLEVIRSEKPDLVLCDMTMPTMSGDQLLRTLRDQHPELDEIPFLFLTALADRAAMIEGRKLGADAYLTKPIDFELLLLEIECRLTQGDRIAQIKKQELVQLYRAMSKPDQSAPTANSLEAIANAASLGCRQIKTGDGNLCRMSACAFDSPTVQQMKSLAPASDDRFSVSLDLLLLSKICERIRDDLDGGNPSIWIARVHYSTLMDEGHLKRFDGACAALADPVRRQLGLEIVEVPTALLGTRIHELTSRTAPLARLKLFEIEPEGLSLLCELRTTFRLATIDAQDLAKLADSNPDRVERSIRELQGKGIKLMVKNSDDPELRAKLTHLNMDFFV